MRVLITGATGLVGRRLGSALSEDGHDVWTLSRRPDARRPGPPTSSRVLRWSPYEQPPAEAFDGVEAVVHLAGERVAGLWTPSKRRAIRESRELGTRNLVHALEDLKQRPRTLVSASAVGYYGDGGEQELTEESAPAGDFLGEVCQAWEREAGRAGTLGMRVSRLRFAPILSSEGGLLPAMLPAYRFGLGGRVGSGRQWWPWAHIDDVIGMIRFALEHALDGPFNVCAPGIVRQREFASALGRALGRPAFVPLPALVVKLLLGGFSTELLASRKVLPRATEAAGFRFRHPELGPALLDAINL